MAAEQRGGRPRASSRETLAEAASELFLEKGFDKTSVADITTRAGVSRSSFFNYFATKSDVLWGGLDERIVSLRAALRADDRPEVEDSLRGYVHALADGFAPDALALAVAQAEAMGIAGELVREAGVRRSWIASSVAERLRRAGVPALRAEVVGAAYGGAVLAAVEQWAGFGPGPTPLADVLREALEAVPVADAAAAAGRGEASRSTRFDEDPG